MVLFGQRLVQLVVIPVAPPLLLQTPRVQLPYGVASLLQLHHLRAALPRLQHRQLVLLELLDFRHPGPHLLRHHDLYVEAGVPLP